jgi:hypothetical protein
MVCLAVAVFGIGRHEFAHLDAFQRPAVGAGDGMQFVARLGHADVEHLLVLVTASQNELHPQRRFAGARLDLDEVKTAQDKAAAEDVVQTRQPGGGSIATAQSSHSRNSARGATGTPTRPPALDSGFCRIRRTATPRFRSTERNHRLEGR